MSKTHVSAIVAMDIHNGIGKDRKMPWHIPEDFKHFKEYTKGKTCLMGRHTYEDILSYKKNPQGDFLPQRNCIVLTTDPSKYCDENTYDNITFSNEHMDSVREYIKQGLMGDSVCIIGGASLFEEFVDIYDEVSITEICKDFECDTFVNREELVSNMTTYQYSPMETDKDYAVGLFMYKKGLL